MSWGDPSSGWQRTWELTAPESYVLRYAPVMRVGAAAFKLALQELVVRDALRALPVRSPNALRLVRAARSLITEGPEFGHCAEPALVPLLELYAGARRRRLPVGSELECEGILVGDFAQAARKAFGGHRGYVDRCVAPVLEQRGLLRLERHVGVAGRPRYSYTAAGRRADDELERRLRKPGRGAGTAVLLLDRLLGAQRPVAPEPADPTVELAAFEHPDGPSLDDLGFALAALDLDLGGGAVGAGGDG
jgi:hypothetical protein